VMVITVIIVPSCDRCPTAVATRPLARLRDRDDLALNGDGEQACLERKRLRCRGELSRDLPIAFPVFIDRGCVRMKK
jgi:hypothetical protein